MTIKSPEEEAEALGQLVDFLILALEKNKKALTIENFTEVATDFNRQQKEFIEKEKALTITPELKELNGNIEKFIRSRNDN